MLIGHQKQWRFLEQSAKLNRLSHAYLFSGPEKVGKKTAALELASQLHCSFPDLILIEPELESKEIKIDQIRDLIWKLSLKPYSAPLKVAIIDQAQTMNQESQNCFLKTLEEPKKDTLLILIAEYPKSLLSTILSRCQTINFQPLPQKEMENNFSKEIAEISLGRPGRAVDFLDPQKLDEFKKNINEVAGLVHSDFSSRFQCAKEIFQKDNLKEILITWLFYFRNLLLAPGGEHYANVLKKIQETNSLISSTNVSPRLALEILMLEF